MMHPDFNANCSTMQSTKTAKIKLSEHARKEPHNTFFFTEFWAIIRTQTQAKIAKTALVKAATQYHYILELDKVLLVFEHSRADGSTPHAYAQITFL